jgi:hypothetical protein
VNLGEIGKRLEGVATRRENEDQWSSGVRIGVDARQVELWWLQELGTHLTFDEQLESEHHLIRPQRPKNAQLLQFRVATT